ncbi:fibronectin type III domain-containing protein, partial [Candidatus Nomurabacteria bacterium]|nr:fibronectin type III domain-containing protein [Candidatus Nomurabacteria bacterium]
NLLNGTSPIQMLGYTVTGLNPNTTYTFRIVYGNSAGNITGEWVSFTTANSNGTGGGSGTGGNGNGSGGSGGGGGCNTLPIITNITPNFVTTGSTARSITINGFNFINNTTIAKINSNSRPINFIDSSKIEINLLASDMASSGTASIITTNDSWCNSNSVTLTIGQNTNTTNTSGGGGGGGLLIYSPTTSNTNATNITSNSVKLNSSISSNGSTPVVWFEYGTNSNLSSFNETIHIAPDSSNGYFSQDLTNLNPDTIYYFRSAINNSYGTSKSNIVSFKTLANPSLASTIQVTNQTQSSAKLNAIFINQNNISAQGYFEYGNTLDLGNTTTLIDLGSSNSMFSSTIINLKSDTVYYFRGIVKTSDKIYRGDILSFKTNTININTAQNTNTIIKEENTSSKLESSIIDIKNDKDFLDIGDEVEYIVNINNNTNEELKNVKIYIQLPKEIDPIKANLGQISNDNNVIFDFDTLPIAQIGTIKITGKVNSKALDQSTLVTTAILSYSTNNHPANIDEIAYSTNHIKTNGQLSANVNFSGVNFLPSTLIEWIMLLIIILGITMIVRYYLLP